MTLPALFIGHGNPMNAIADNAFTNMLAQLGKSIPRPEAVVCVSAHWMTEGTWATAMAKPKTIHDFYGFPQELFEVDYPAPGSREIAELVSAAVQTPAVQLDQTLWGLDHGAWSVLRHMYPKADVPVVQLSLYLSQPPRYHYQIGQRLRALRDQGILVVGSGNIVHNLKKMRWEEGAKPYAWALDFDEWVKARLLDGDTGALLEDPTQLPAGPLAIPGPDHWYPFLYTLGARRDGEAVRFEYEGIENGSISMRCVSFGRS